ncbi:MAG TPA: hypothetical protein VF530_18085 [Planctomycetota bacterium]
MLALLGACEGDTGPAGPAGPAGPPGGGGGGDPDDLTPTAYVAGQRVPELIVRIEELSGASGPGGEFLVGDVLAVTFAVEKADGTPWKLEELDEAEALVSGPSTNYQRVLPVEGDVAARATLVEAGRFRFTFAAPLPDVYPPPFNDSTSFGRGHGELAGQALRDGTYTLGLSFTWAYTLDARPYRRVGEATLDFLVGTGAGAPATRAVTSAEHCNRCHGALQAHDGRYRKLELCLLCHTSGAEDANLPAVEGGTPGVSIDSRVLFHRLHAGRFLPSVNGIASRANGTRNYGVAPEPLRYVRASGAVRDFSHVGFPAFPNRADPMPRDTGYNNLSSEAKAKEDRMRSMPTQCALCHGDPDGGGPIGAPAQGGLSNLPSRRACGSCHDDVNFENSYQANNQSMPPQPNDNGCNACHDSRQPGPLSPIEGHLHPTADVGLDPGVNLAFLAFAEAGAHDSDGRLEAGEGARVSFRLTNDQGQAQAPASLDELRVVLAGPLSNPQVLYEAAIPTALVTGAQPFDLVLPERVVLEHLGDSATGLETFRTARFPHRTATGVVTEVLVRTGTAGGASVLATARARRDNFVDVLDASAFARDDVVVLDDGVAGREEYLRVQHVEGNRLWFSAPNLPAYPPGLRTDHAAGASVLEVQLLARQSPFHYTLDPVTGTITEVAEFGAGSAVLASYTCDWVAPADYPGPANDSPARGELHGEWSGKPLVAGTYRAALAAARDFEFRLGTTATPYRRVAPGATLSFLVGDAPAEEPYTLVDATSCSACHQELVYHGTYRGLETCLTCHGAAGTEDRPRYASPNAPETAGLSVEFRALIHRIHRGRELADDSFQVVTQGGGSFPDDFATRSYHAGSTLPAFPDRTLECARCHGADNLEALLPTSREHPTDQRGPLQVWRPVCSGCHDGAAVTAHIDSNTAPNGAEACEICHAPGEFLDARAAHLSRLEPR